MITGSDIAAQVLKVCEEKARKEALSVPLPQFRERASNLTGISPRTLSRIKSEPGKGILKSRKPRSDRIELDDFDNVYCGEQYMKYAVCQKDKTNFG